MRLLMMSVCSFEMFWSLPLGSFHHPTNSRLACYRADLFLRARSSQLSSWSGEVTEVTPAFCSIFKWQSHAAALQRCSAAARCFKSGAFSIIFTCRVACQAALLSICHFMGIGILINLVIGILGSGVLQVARLPNKPGYFDQPKAKGM